MENKRLSNPPVVKNTRASAKTEPAPNAQLLSEDDEIADADVRLARRIRRDTVEKGRDIGAVLDQYSKFVKPAFDDFILPTKKYADIIIPRGGDNHVAVDLIVQHIRTKLGQHDLCKIYPNLYVIQTTFQLINEKLPKDIAERHVLLLDPILGTGNSAIQAISLLIQKGVPEPNIIFLNLISAPQGVHMVCKTFSRIKIVTSEINIGLNEDFRVVPGMGEYVDRYFGIDDDDQRAVDPAL
ncbi:hypothetical protein NL676_025503 [Syzygium grande]|nr:hypothetical protein NL676_025503 [Syzygium grande]